MISDGTVVVFISQDNVTLLHAIAVYTDMNVK